MLVGGYVVLTTVFLLIGLMLTRVLADHGLDGFDRRTTTSLADHRTAAVNDITKWATYLANTEGVVAIAAVVTLVLLVRRHWRHVIFLVTSLVIELTVFLSANYTVHRDRPDVVRLNATPSTGSYPSGHSAATLVLWVGIALIVTALTAKVLWRVLAWIPAATLPALVSFARVYRGMHYTTDVLTGLALGGAALVVGGLVARTWVAARSARAAAEFERDEAPAATAAAWRGRIA